MWWVLQMSCPYTCDQHTHLQILSNWCFPYSRLSVGFANEISQYLTKYSSLCFNGSMYTLHCLTHTLVLTYLVHHTHILSIVLYSSQHPAFNYRSGWGTLLHSTQKWWVTSRIFNKCSGNQMQRNLYKPSSKKSMATWNVTSGHCKRDAKPLRLSK